MADNASDANGNPLTFAKVSGPSWLSVAANGALSGTPTNSNVGANSFTVSVSDGIAAAVQATLNITVINTNDAPVFATNPIVGANATEDAAYSGTLAGSASDVDAGATLTYAKVSGPTWLSVASSGALSGTPTSSNAGLNTFTVSVSDGIAPAVSATLNITVVVARSLYSSGAKTWDTSTANWGTVTGGPYNTTTWSGGDSAIFEGTAGTVTLGGAISIKDLTINTASYTITGSTLNFTSGNINIAAASTIRSAITGTPTMTDGGAAGSITTLDPTSGNMTLGAVTRSVDKHLYLRGSSTSVNSIASIAKGHANAKLRVESGNWTFGNVYAGEFQITGGSLTLNGTLNNEYRSTKLLAGGTINYNNPAAIRDGSATFGTTNNDFVLNGGVLDQTSGAAITTSTHNPDMDWVGNWTFVGSNGANSNLFLGNGRVNLNGGTRQVTVENAATTLALGGVIQQVSGSGNGLTKAGDGTLELRGVSTYTGATTVNAGKLKLGANNVLPNGSNVIIGTATLDADTRTDTAGTLDVTGAAVINLGSGAALAFADSKAVDWTGGTLNITGTLGATSLRFGNSADDLTSGQLAKISVNGGGLGTYILDANGYLVAGGGGGSGAFAATSMSDTTTITDNSHGASTDDGASSGSNIDNVNATGDKANPAPSPWATQDIGAAGVEGGLDYTDGAFRLRGAGKISGTADTLRSVHQVSSGDCQITARVSDLSGATTAGKAGVMMRESLGRNAREAGVWVTPGGRIVFTYRTATGGTTESIASARGMAAPYWVRLNRTGNSFTAYTSADGTAWTQLGKPQTIGMATSAYLSLGVCSGSSTKLATGSMDNVTAAP